MITYRNIYYLSENTGILAKDMGKAILCQFPDTCFREKRFPGSAYAQLETCESELVQANNIFDSYNFPVVFSDRQSIEETATQVYQHLDRITYPKTVS